MISHRQLGDSRIHFNSKMYCKYFQLVKPMAHKSTLISIFWIIYGRDKFALYEMAVTAISLVLIFLCLARVAAATGTFYQKISKVGDDAEVFTQGFHQCNFENNCQYVGIPVSNAGDKAFFASTMQELQAEGKNLQIWRKNDPSASKHDSSNAQGKTSDLIFSEL